MDEENFVEFADMIEEITTKQPTLGEVKAAIGRLKNGKSPGIDSITAELLKADADFSAAKKIHQSMKKVWEHEKIPTKWKQGLIIKLAKKGGNLKECKNSRRITLLSVVSKILGRIIIDRVRNGVDQSLRKEQAGYRRGRGTTDQVFVLRNIVEQVNEWEATLYLDFIDFEKAFDSIHRDSLWIIMRKYGIPEKIVRISNYFMMVSNVQLKIKETGVKQGCNMSGFLFLIVLDWVKRRTVGNGENGIRWKLTSKVDDLDFADDIALLSATKQQIQDKTRKLNVEATRVGMKISVEKTKTMRMNSKNQAGQ